MGLSNTITPVQGGGHKISIVGGKWTLRVAEGTPGAESRKLTKGKNAGQQVYELKYSAIEGFIQSGRLTENEFIGLEAEVSLADGRDNYDISLPAESRYLKEFIKRLPNINPAETVRMELVLNPKRKTRTGGDCFNLHVLQNGRMVDDFYTDWKRGADGKPVATLKHGMPEAVKTRTGWDFKAQDEFLFDKFEEFFAVLNPEFPSEPDEDDGRVPFEVTAQDDGLRPESEVQKEEDNLPF